ncbi:MAG: cupin domain-containing protein [Verrucomicrobiota bacterium]
MQRYEFAQRDSTPGVPCACGTSRRAFASPENTLATAHLVEISEDARTHYHKRLTETYVILEGEGFLELDGKRIPVKPLSTILIRPGCRHRAVGKMKVLNFVVPAFDPADECFEWGARSSDADRLRCCAPFPAAATVAGSCRRDFSTPTPANWKSSARSIPRGNA